MAEITITHRIDAPELSSALNNLAEALRLTVALTPATVAETGSTVAVNPSQTVQGVPVEAASTMRIAENTAVQNDAPKTAAQTVPEAPVMRDAPIAAAPSPAPNEPSKVCTFEDIKTAGSQLLEAGKMTQLMELLKSYGVQALTQLKPEQYPDVATALRGLGATI